MRKNMEERAINILPLKNPLKVPLSTAETRNWTIYKITSPSGNIYIGKTHAFESRMKNYKSESGGGCNQQPILYNSIKKYGFKNHSVEIIEQFFNYEWYANDKEMFWIRSYMTNLNKWRNMNGMNLTDGGDGSLGNKIPNRVSAFKGKKHTEETKRLLSEATKNNPNRWWLGKRMSEEAKEKMSIAKKGKPSPLRGYKHSAETIEKNRLAHLGKPSPFKGKSIWSDDDRKRIGDSKRGNTYMLGKRHTDESKTKIALSNIYRSRSILQYDLIGNLVKEHISIRGACRDVGMSKSSMVKILNGITKAPKQFIFKYK